MHSLTHPAIDMRIHVRACYSYALTQVPLHPHTLTHISSTLAQKYTVRPHPQCSRRSPELSLKVLSMAALRSRQWAIAPFVVVVCCRIGW